MTLDGKRYRLSDSKLSCAADLASGLLNDLMPKPFLDLQLPSVVPSIPTVADYKGSIQGHTCGVLVVDLGQAFLLMRSKLALHHSRPQGKHGEALGPAVTLKPKP